MRPDQKPKNAKFWTLAGEKLTIAANAAGQTLQIVNNAGSAFYAERLKVIARLNADVTAAQKGTQLAIRPSATEQSNTLGPSTLVKLNVKVGQDTWFSASVSVAALMGEEGEGFYFSTFPAVAPNQPVIVTIDNGPDYVIDLEFIAFGFTVPAQPGNAIAA